MDAAEMDLDVGTTSIEFSPDSKLLAFKGDDGFFYLLEGKDWEMTKMDAVYSFNGRGTRRAFRFSRDGSTLTWASDESVWQWRLNYSGPNKELDTPVEGVEVFQHPGSKPSIGYNCPTEWVVTSYASDLTLYKIRDKQPLLTLCNTNGFIREFL